MVGRKQKIDSNNMEVSEQQIITKMENTQSKGLKRNTIDKYYTKADVVDLCIDIVKKHIEIKEDD